MSPVFSVSLCLMTSTASDTATLTEARQPITLSPKLLCPTHGNRERCEAGMVGKTWEAGNLSLEAEVTFPLASHTSLVNPFHATRTLHPLTGLVGKIQSAVATCVSRRAVPSVVHIARSLFFCPKSQTTLNRPRSLSCASVWYTICLHYKVPWMGC